MRLWMMAAAAAMVSATAPAGAAVRVGPLFSFIDGPTFAPGYSHVDYTLPSGRSRITLQTPNNPNADIELSGPPQLLNGYIFTRSTYGIDVNYDVRYDVSFVQEFKRGGVVTYVTEAPKSFYKCSEKSALGKICGTTYIPIGNGELLTLTDSSATGHILVDDTVAALPEPSTWAMMIGGIGIIGGALRRRPARRCKLQPV